MLGDIPIDIPNQNIGGDVSPAFPKLTPERGWGKESGGRNVAGVILLSCVINFLF